MIRTVYRNSAGAVINIGKWDAQTQPWMTDLPDGVTVAEEPLEDGSHGFVWRDADCREIAPLTIDCNPLPAGATISDEEIVEGWDGGLYVKGDPRAKL